MTPYSLCRYDQDVVKNLMPLIVNVLESLDLAYTESSEFEVDEIVFQQSAQSSRKLKYSESDSLNLSIPIRLANLDLPRCFAEKSIYKKVHILQCNSNMVLQSFETYLYNP